MTFELSRLFSHWPLPDVLRILAGKLLFRFRIVAFPHHVIEEAEYRRIESLGFTITRHKTLLSIKRMDWKIPGLFLRKLTSDFHVFKQLFLKNEFDAFFSMIGSQSVYTIIDAGANIGAASLRFQQQFPQAKIYAIEPDDENYKCLLYNAHVNGVNLVPVKAGIWSRNTTLFFDYSFRDRKEWSVALTEKPNAGKRVNCLSLNTLIEQEKIEWIDILKIDIEGSERAVFAPESDLSFLHRTRFLAIELHHEFDVRNQIGSLLVNKGFQLAESGEYLIGRNLSKT